MKIINYKSYLHQVAAEGDLPPLNYCLEVFPNLSEPDDNGLTPLDWAVRNDHENIAKILRERGAKPSGIDPKSAELHWIDVPLDRFEKSNSRKVGLLFSASNRASKDIDVVKMLLSASKNYDERNLSKLKP